jgi:excisionase family DNA binding protein
MTQKFASIDEVARFMGVGRHTVRSLITNGELRAVTVGRYRRIPTADALAFVNRQLAIQSDQWKEAV